VKNPVKKLTAVNIVARPIEIDQTEYGQNASLHCAHFLFFVLVNEGTIIQKYYVIMFVFVFTEQGKMGKTEI
jgi:hypothetical protein